MKTNLFLEDVFCDSGVPQYTFVEPSEYTKTKVGTVVKRIKLYNELIANVI